MSQVGFEGRREGEKGAHEPPKAQQTPRLTDPPTPTMDAFCGRSSHHMWLSFRLARTCSPRCAHATLSGFKSDSCAQHCSVRHCAFGGCVRMAPARVMNTSTSNTLGSRFLARVRMNVSTPPGCESMETKPIGKKKEEGREKRESGWIGRHGWKSALLRG